MKQGDLCTEIGFIQSGILIEIESVDGKEITRWIYSEGEFVSDLSSFTSEQKTIASYQAVENVEMCAIGKKDFDRLSQHIPAWRDLELRSLTECSQALKNRLTTQLSMKAEERYKHFFEQNPSLFNRVPLIHIASVLGMSPETLSRIRKKQITPTS